MKEFSFSCLTTLEFYPYYSGLYSHILFCSCVVFCFTNFLNESRLAAQFFPLTSCVAAVSDKKINPKWGGTFAPCFKNFPISLNYYRE